MICMLKPGDKAPTFSLKNQDGETIKLSDFLGKRVLLYFYPRDDTPGCTSEACNLRDNHGTLSRNLVVLGISMDTTQSPHKKFADKYKLPFPLLSDSGEVCKKYGVYVQKNMYGKKYWGIKRTSFIIDENGKIAKIFDKVDVDNHAEQVMDPG